MSPTSRLGRLPPLCRPHHLSLCRPHHLSSPSPPGLLRSRSSLINGVCHVKNKDIRKFLDGIYVSFKGNITELD